MCKVDEGDWWESLEDLGWGDWRDWVCEGFDGRGEGDFEGMCWVDERFGMEGLACDDLIGVQEDLSFKRSALSCERELGCDCY